MTFLSGWRLVLLLAPIALLVAYVLVQRRRHAQVVRFTSVDLLDSVAPKRSGWQRHVPAAGVLASLVVLTIAFAQPVMAAAARRVDRATILLTLDTSASMAADRRRRRTGSRPPRSRRARSSTRCPTACRSAS